VKPASMSRSQLRIHPPPKCRRLDELPTDFWDRNRLQSGRLLDELLAQNIPFNSRAIDRTEGSNHFVSHKSTDLRRKTYQSLSRLRRLGKSFVRALSMYTGEVRQDHQLKVTYYLMVPPFVTPDEPVRKTLEWYVPIHGVSVEQERVLREVEQFGAEHSVTVKVIRI
jgi:hypothetical protein